MQEVMLTGGEQVYCISEAQLRRALELTKQDPVRGPLIERRLQELEVELDRNERAAIAFLLIDRLQHSER